MPANFGRELEGPNSTHVDRSSQKSLKPSCCEALVPPVRDLINPFWAIDVFFPALAEMESMLLSVAKERKSQRKKSVFVDTLLQSSLTERQVRSPTDTWEISLTLKGENRSK